MVTYAQSAVRLGTTESAIKSAVPRLRRRYAELVREEIAHTVNSPGEIDEEIESERRIIPQDAEDLRRGIALYLNDDFSSRGRYRFYRGAESLLQCGCKHRR